MPRLLTGKADSIGPERITDGWRMVFFGYTYCPDICPTVLSELAAFYDAAGKVQMTPPAVIFISVDPDRDKPEMLVEYAASFEPSFIGATASKDDIAALEKQLDTHHIIGKEDADGNYAVGHSAIIYLLDPRNRLVAKIRPPFRAEEMVKSTAAIQAFVGTNNL